MPRLRAAPARAASFGGCWSITRSTPRSPRAERASPASSAAQAAHYVDGGIDDAWPMMWIHGPMWGYAAATSHPMAATSARSLSTRTAGQQRRPGWIGSRCDGTHPTQTPPSRRPITSADRPLGESESSSRTGSPDRKPSAATLDAAATLLRAAPSQRFRIVATEFRHNDPTKTSAARKPASRPSAPPCNRAASTSRASSSPAKAAPATTSSDRRPSNECSGAASTSNGIRGQRAERRAQKQGAGSIFCPLPSALCPLK